VLLGTQETVEILAEVEKRTASAALRPRYVLTAWSRAPAVLSLVQAGGDDLRRRLLGTIPGRQSTLFDSYALRYKSTYGSLPQTIGAANAYDAAYLLAYGLAAAGPGPLTGTAIAAGLGRTVGGVPLEVGPNPINAAFGVLSEGKRIDFTGASGPLDFDLSTGEAPADIDIWCVRQSPAGELIFEPSGRYFDADRAELVGAIDCP
jgi:ABC-type branched-subunit amino acid transport system substrate-binding protein